MNYGAHESQLRQCHYMPAKHPLSPNGLCVSPPTSLSGTIHTCRISNVAKRCDERSQLLSPHLALSRSECKLTQYRLDFFFLHCSVKVFNTIISSPCGRSLDFFPHPTTKPHNPFYPSPSSAATSWSSSYPAPPPLRRMFIGVTPSGIERRRPSPHPTARSVQISLACR